MGKRKGLNGTLNMVDEKNRTEFPNTSTKLLNGVPQVQIKQSVTLLALRNSSSANTTAAPDTLQPRLFFGVLTHDTAFYLGAIIVAVCGLLLVVWKCCSRITVSGKKKEYWLNSKGVTSPKGKYRLPVVNNSSVVFLGLKPVKPFDYRSDISFEDCKTSSMEEDLRNASFCSSLPVGISHSPQVIISYGQKSSDQNGSSNLISEGSTHQYCSVISVSPLLDNQSATESGTIMPDIHINIPNAIVHQDSPRSLQRFYSTGAFDQCSLYNHDSNKSSDATLKKASSFTWSNRNRRPSSDNYYDLFQKANFCKKRKNRMRSDIAAAIALNRSESSQLNRDTELLVVNEVEIISDERTPL